MAHHMLIASHLMKNNKVFIKLILLKLLKECTFQT